MKIPNSNVFYNDNKSSYFLLLSVSVIPCDETLKWTTVVLGMGSVEKVTLAALATA